MKRQPDGTWRGARQPVAVSDSVLRARWVETETVRLKSKGFSFDEIAGQITRVGRGQSQSLTPLPPGISFPPDYVISKQGCQKAFKKAIAREPALEVEEFRKIDTARCEEMFLSLQVGIRKGNPNAIATGVKVLDHTAKINGYAVPQRHELTGRDGKPLTLVQLLQAVGPIGDEDEK